MTHKNDNLFEEFNEHLKFKFEVYNDLYFNREYHEGDTFFRLPRSWGIYSTEYNGYAYQSELQRGYNTLLFVDACNVKQDVIMSISDDKEQIKLQENIKTRKYYTEIILYRVIK